MESAPTAAPFSKVSQTPPIAEPCRKIERDRRNYRKQQPRAAIDEGGSGHCRAAISEHGAPVDAPMNTPDDCARPAPPPYSGA